MSSLKLNVTKPLGHTPSIGRTSQSGFKIYFKICNAEFYAPVPGEAYPTSARWYKDTLHYGTMNVNEPLDLLGKFHVSLHLFVIFHSACRILFPQTLMVSLQYYL